MRKVFVIFPNGSSIVVEERYKCVKATRMVDGHSSFIDKTFYSYIEMLRSFCGPLEVVNFRGDK